MDDFGEPAEVEKAEVEVVEAKPPKKSRKKLIAIAIVAILVGAIGVWWLFFTNNPPVASLRLETDDMTVYAYGDASADSDGITSYSWNWGDGSAAGSGISAHHEYSSEGVKPVVLTVTDARGATATVSGQIEVRIAPTAVFVARQERMTSTFDASLSFSRRGGAITDYQWDFGDGSTGTGVQPTHTYQSAQRYVVRLTVTDASGKTASTTRFVSPADTTVDILADKFFEAGCPYDDYWFLRKASYGDAILNNVKPCTDFYPWVLVTARDPVTGRTLSDVNPTYVYTLYRFDARVRNYPGYSLTEPVLLPVFNSSVAPLPTSYLRLNLTFDYLNTTLFDTLAGTPFEVDPGLGDGFGYLVQGTITMDLTMSRRIFGVDASTATEAAAWWAANTRYASGSGSAESRLSAWLEQEGKGSPPGTGKYDVYNAFEWYYVTDITDLNATVAPDGTTTIQVFWDGFGYEVLLARWFYWGTASYRDAVNQAYGAIQPRGWLPMETCWCERAKINATIGSTLDLDFTAYQGYNFEAWGNWGADSVPGTADDQPSWVFSPYLMDYVPREGSGSKGSQGYPNSELRWYEGLTSVHGAPGSYSYGEPYDYIVSPTRWVLKAGSTLTIVLPTFDVLWYDPARSTWNTQTLVGDYETFMAPMTLRLVKADDGLVGPGDFYLWDSRGKVLSIAGPHDWGTNSLPLSGSPWIEFAPQG